MVRSTITDNAMKWRNSGVLVYGTEVMARAGRGVAECGGADRVAEWRTVLAMQLAAR